MFGQMHMEVRLTGIIRQISGELKAMVEPYKKHQKVVHSGD
jgi:hypothetical protein